MQSCVEMEKQKGFTLLEIIIVLVLISLILGLSSVFFAGFLPSAKLNATGREISAVIRHARSLARTTMDRQAVLLDLDNRSYSIEGQAARNIPPEVLVKVVDPASGEIMRGKYRIVFYPSGEMEGGTIILSGRKKVIKIDMDPITGVVWLKS